MEQNTVEVKSDEDSLNPDLVKELEKDSPLKEWLVVYVVTQHNPENDQVTLAMVIDVMAKEFPEFLLALAEENWIRGSHQAIQDMETGRKLYEEEMRKQAETGPEDKKNN